MKSNISIIIPILNEEKVIESFLRELSTLKGEKEIILVDGGSTDNTVEIASKYGKVVKSKKGRAFQMNAGAKAATGEVFWFLHCDSKIEEDSLNRIEKAINEGYVGGGFSLNFYDLNSKFMKFVSITSNWRAKYLGYYFGDQAIFVKKEIFEAMGGFKEIDIMEDWDFSCKLKKIGKMKMIKSTVGTSARRFKQGGQLKTLLLMHKIKILYMLGVSPSKLNKIYREAR
ncbi:TIGR04283 family arsenosugar biosynthesis glycosyltransferase [Clostridium malenominatum]|uniref:4,4'-diaponeurosporenoate glycosyltransferase n=1 Tax=Clostridium malenominatum TaxID=1539 RepID=A0ABN1IRJ6_9CLOT